MTREDIIRMAREADIEFDLIDEDEGQIWYITSKGLERFAALVAAASEAKEREACAKVCEDDALSSQYGERSKYRGLLVATIRARGQQ